MQITNLATSLGMGIAFKTFTITYKDLQKLSGAGAKTIKLFTLPKKGKILGVNIKHSVPFAGGNLNAMTVSVGDADSATQYSNPAFNIFQAAADNTLQETAAFKSIRESAHDVIATFTPGVDPCSAATAGSVDIDICYLNVTTP